jgi:methionyl-tRNA formyltransferase
MKTSAKVIFFGNERLATGLTTEAPTLTRLISAGYEVLAVVTKQDSANSSRKNRLLEIEEVANKNNIPVLKPAKILDIKNDLKNLGAQVGVLAAYGKIVPLEIIDLFPLGILNIHPSLLPKGRGPTPIESVILDGSSETGVSIMQLGEKMDAGDVFEQVRYKIPSKITKQELADKLLDLGSNLLIEIMPRVINGDLTPKAQDDTKATYNKLITKEDGVVDWTKSSEQIEKEIRAYDVWPKTRGTINGLDVIINQAQSIDSSDSATPGSLTIDQGRLLVSCGRGVLEIIKLTPINKNEMTAASFLAGYKSRIM